MNEQTKSLIRHVLTALGFVLAAIGLNQWTGLIDILSQNLDGVWVAIEAALGFVLMLVGFFKDRKRHAEREAGASN